jgi:predicted metal-dependent hydrolase
MAGIKAKITADLTKLALRVPLLVLQPLAENIRNFIRLDQLHKSRFSHEQTHRTQNCPSPDSCLCFNDELLGMDRELGDYVIVHELLHFPVPNHEKSGTFCTVPFTPNTDY